MKHNPIDKLMLLLIAVAVCALALLNLFQFDRPTVSETENRNLATMPTLSVEKLLDSSYFSELSAFFSDTFFGREAMVSLSKKMDRLKSLSIFRERDGISVIIDPNATVPPSTDEVLPTLPPWTPPTQKPTTTKPTVPTDPTEPTDPTNKPTDPTTPTTKPTDPTTPTTKPTDPTTPTTKPTDPTTPTTKPTDPTTPTTKPTEPTVPSTPVPTQPTEPVIPLLLTTDSITITAGASQTLTAVVGKGYSGLSWKSSNTNVATVSVSGTDSVTVTAVAKGTATITATVKNANGQSYSLSCSVTVKEPEIERPDNVADFLPNGMIIYNDAAYSQSYYVKSVATSMAQIYDRYALMFPDATVSVVQAPLATITITDPTIAGKVSNEGTILDNTQALMPDSVNFVNLKNIYKAHADEYLFFKSDHHWTHRGAYYAYHEFVKSLGMTPTPIDQFQVKVLNKKYIGSMYGYTGDDRVKTFYDTVEAYLPTKACKMTIYGTQWGTLVRNWCIATDYTNYLAFLMGDNGYTVINVPSNPQDKNILVIKDSYGNAFVPYLTEHYGNIYVVDLRHVKMNIYDEFKDANLTDIVFVLNNQSANNSAWYKYFYNAIV